MKKFNTIIKFLIALCILGTSIIACSEEENESDNLNKLKTENLTIKNFKNDANTSLNYNNGIHTIKFYSELSNNIITSKVEIYDYNTDKLIQSTTFVLDRNLTYYKLGVFKKVEEISFNVRSSLSENKWLQIENSYELFVKKTLREIDSTMYKSDLIQSIFYHLSIYNTVVRSFKSQACKCTPLPAYFVNKSSFWCQEDYSFNKSNMQYHLEKNKEKFIGDERGRKLYNFIMNYKGDGEVIPYIDIFSEMYSIEHFRQSLIDYNSYSGKNSGDCWFGAGSDLGCCGNYGGCCWMATRFCLLHDIDCIGCSHWHCGWACE